MYVSVWRKIETVSIHFGYTTEGQTEEGGQFLSWETLFQVEEDYVDLLRCGVHSYKSTINVGRDFHNLSERKKNSVNSTKSAYF